MYLVYKFHLETKLMLPFRKQSLNLRFIHLNFNKMIFGYLTRKLSKRYICLKYLIILHFIDKLKFENRSNFNLND